MRLTVPKLRMWHLLGIVAATAAYIAVFQYRWTVFDNGYAVIRRLRSFDAKERAKAASAVVFLRPVERRAVAPLTELLFDDDATVRAVAADSLLHLVAGNGRTPPDDAVAGPVKAALASALGDRDPVARLAMANTFSRLGGEPKNVVPTLLEFAADRDGRNRSKAITILGLYVQQSEPALNAVLDACNDADRQVREDAIDAAGFGVISPKTAPSPILERVKIAILAKSGDPAQSVRLAAISAMAHISQRTNVEDPRVIPFMSDPDPQVRLAACNYQAWWFNPTKRSPLFVPAFERALKDPDASVRNCSVYVLSRFGMLAESSLPALRLMLDNPNKDDNRGEIIAAISAIEADARKFREETLPQFIAGLADADPINRAIAAEQIAEFGPRASKAVPALIRGLDDREADVRRASARALGQLGPEAGEALSKLEQLAKSDDDERVRRVSAGSRAILLRDAPPSR